MNSYLCKTEQHLRSIAKRNESVRYSLGLVILFLMLGGGAFSEEIQDGNRIANTSPTREQILSRETLRSLVGNLQSKIASARAENEKGLAGLRLELIQLMEQGNQVVKSPWPSWQFGVNHMYSQWNAVYEGRGDKSEKYPFEGTFTRSGDLFLRNIHPDSKNYEKYTSFMPGVISSFFTFSAGGNNSKRVFAVEKQMGVDKSLATTSLRGGDEDSYGLGNSKIKQEEIAKIELGASVRPRKMDKETITVEAPKKPSLNKPEVLLPKSPNAPEAPTAPTLSLNAFEPVVPKSPNPELGDAEIFNIKLGSFGNYMTHSNYNKHNEDGGGLAEGSDPNARSYGDHEDKSIKNEDLKNGPSIRYSWATSSDTLGNGEPGFNSALLKVYFDYGRMGSTDSEKGKTLTIESDVKQTIDSINSLTETQITHEKEKNRIWNTGKFLTGGSRFATMDNARDATIENKGTINLTGPLVAGFEVQSDTLGSGKRTIKNSGTITDEKEEEYRDDKGLGGLQVGKVNEAGEEVETVGDSTELTLPPFARGLDGKRIWGYFSIEGPPTVGDKLKVKRASDIVNSKNEVIKRGGYTGHKVGMILTYENNDSRRESLYSLINTKEGKIEFKGEKSIGMQIYAPNSPEINVNVKNEGTISMGGAESYGIKISSRIADNRQNDENNETIKEIGNAEKGTINVSGGNGKVGSFSSGIAVIEDENLFPFMPQAVSQMEAYAYAAPMEQEKNIRAYKDYIKNKGTINVSGGTGNTGMYLKIYKDDDITNEGNINVSGIKNIGMRVTGGSIDINHSHDEWQAVSLYRMPSTPLYHMASVEDDEDVNGFTSSYYYNNMPYAYNKSKITLTDGEENIGMVANGSFRVGSIAENKAGGEIIISGGNKNIGMLSTEAELEMIPMSLDYFGYERYGGRGIVKNLGTIKATENSKNAIGMTPSTSEKSNSVALNLGKGKIDLKGEGSIGVYNSAGTFEMRNESEDIPEISVAGKNSIAVYASKIFGTQGRQEGIFPTGEELGTSSSKEEIFYQYNGNLARIKSGKVSAEKGIVLYADDAIIELGRNNGVTDGDLKNSPELTAKSGALMFYNYTHSDSTPPKSYGSFRLSNDVKGIVENGGTAFYLRNVTDKNEFLNKMFRDDFFHTTYYYGTSSVSGYKDSYTPEQLKNKFTWDDNNAKLSVTGKKLSLTMEEGSTLFMTANDNIDDVKSFQSLSRLTADGFKKYGNRVEIKDNSSPYYKIESSLRNKLLVDKNVNLDDRAEVYNRLEYLSSWVTVNSGINMTSNTDDKIAIVQTNVKRENASTLPAPKVEDIKVLNQGTISFTGKKSIGLATSFGLVTNEGKVSVTGEQGVGIYAADSSIAKNTGTIEIGTKGTGIYAENDLKVNGNKTAISTNKDINVTNTGTIEAKENSSGVYGIYAKNDQANYSNASSTVTHSGNIDVAKSTSSVGIYTEHGKLTSSGSIAVGKDSVGISAKNSEVELGENASINASSAVGILIKDGKLKSKANLTVKDGVGLDIEQSDVDIEKGMYTLNKSTAFKIGALDSKKFKGNAGTIKITGKGSVAYYLKNANLTSNSNFMDALTVNSDDSYVYFYAEDSTLNYENQKTINNDGTTLIYAKNSDIILKENTNINSVKKNVTALYSEEAAEKNVVNKGNMMLLGEKSLGIYSKSTHKVENFGNIEVGGKSTAIYAENISDAVENKGTIKLATNSTGISGINSKIRNTADIKSSGTNSGKNIAIYSYGGKEVSNSGNITLLGNQSVGIYSDSSDVINTGKIVMGDSIDSKNPSIGIYSKNGKVENFGELTTGNNSTGIYAKSVNVKENSKLNVGNNSVGIYSLGGDIHLSSASQLSVGDNHSTLLYYHGKNGNIVNNTDKLTVGNHSNAFTIKGEKNKVESNSAGTVNLKNDSVYMYSTDSSGSITNKTNITSSGNDNYGIYSFGKVDNYGNINFSEGTGSIGIYAYYPKRDHYSLSTLSVSAIPTLTNHSGSTIKVAKSDLSDSKNEKYGIGMAAGHKEVMDGIVKQKAIGHIVNEGTISVTSPDSIGMYATGRGSIAENKGRIELSGSKRNIGMFLENGAVGYNFGTIETVGSNNNGQIGVAVTSGATLYNSGTIKIAAETGIGIYSFGGGIIHNTGNFIIEAPEKIKSLDQADTSKGIGGVNIKVREDDKSQADIFVDGKKVETTLVHAIPNRAASEIPISSIGIYMSSSGVHPTKPIGNLGALASSGIKAVDLIIGVEATKHENSKYIQLGQDIIKPYNEMIKKALKKGIDKYEVYSGSLTWQATVTQKKTDQTIQNAYMAKIPYTVYAGDKNTTRDTYHFTDGLEQRYGVESLGSREKELFNKLNSIGNNEGILLKQAFDEMMGHQYANIHQRVRSTGDILDKEFTHLRKDWETASKKSNKIKTFGARGEYKTNTAGILNYTNHAYGVAYVRENEEIKLGKGFGYYAGLVHNTYKFKDIGRSEEEMLQVKAGGFKSISFDDNDSLNWTVSADISYGYNKMNRKFLVVDEIFNARGRYNTYGVAMKNELGKEFRVTETLSLRPYAAIKLEYAKIGKVKEKSGEVKLNVDDSHYTSVKPELGLEANYKYTMSSGKIITARLGSVFEDELGKVAKANNKAKVADTNADWFHLPKEKEDRKGNVKTDFSLGVEGEILGGTVNLGYDTKGNNFRGGIGVRIIF
ncbi:autotransporter-associated N-terminal domain-containing protein [Fusobacterium necrophorum]|uniref:Membrane protein n=1 Tax=Fusobacterium necrophorum DJ-2 TaxID=1441737 RepID=A0AB73C481_9FUSO|nr:autotransporter-associated N-terminal domain-containing protein [Fusobacterium necrophorum]KDE67954.1 membrane protein [Fusobacterium necrophorum DJ-1]KDE72767.1 membrane protein [Fusobacterium necrophorum DJ-2]